MLAKLSFNKFIDIYWHFSSYNIFMTIYALSSGPGISGVAVIRISGEKTKDVIKQIIGRKLPKPRMASLNKIIDIKTKELLDEGIVIWFPGPHSYTGEDMAELHVHGSSAVTARCSPVEGGHTVRRETSARSARWHCPALEATTQA